MWDHLMAGFMPHGHCYQWRPSLLAAQAGTNLLIGLSYLVISLTLVLLVRRVRHLPFDWMYLAFGAFIIACGLTHFMDVLVIWRPAYWLDAALRLLTAIASVGTAVLLVPQVARAAALAERVRERDRLAEELLLSQERCRLIVESARDYALFMLDPAGKVVSWSQGAARLKGYDAREAVGLHLSAFYPAEDVAAGKPEMELRLAREEGRHEDEGWRLRKDGSRFFANAVISAITGSNGELIGFAKVTRDVTARMQAERRAREHGRRMESRNRELAALLEGLFQTAPIGLGYLDRELRYVHLNEHLAELDGLPLEAHRGRTLAEVLPELPAEALRQVADTGGATLHSELNREVASPGGSRERRHWMVTSYPVTVAQRPVGVGLIVEDVTERKRAEAQQARLLAQAQEGVRTRDVFLAVAAHELKTPLTPLRLELDGLLRALRKGRGDLVAAHGRERLELVGRQLTRLERLVGALLDGARLAAGPPPMSPEELDLVVTVQELVARHREELAQAGCPVEVSFDGAELRGRWDRTRVEQIVANLLTNAMKYGAASPITIALSREGGFARLRVQDRGIGVAPADQERIFARFERAASERHYGGLGLGLWIARQAAVAHGGTLTVESQLGRGATFTMTLPLSLDQEHAHAPDPRGR